MKWQKIRPSLEEKIKDWATEIGIEVGEKIAELKIDGFPRVLKKELN